MTFTEASPRYNAPEVRASLEKLGHVPGVHQFPVIAKLRSVTSVPQFSPDDRGLRIPLVIEEGSFDSFDDIGIDHFVLKIGRLVEIKMSLDAGGSERNC